VYRAYIEQPEVFVGIYWQRYGWTGADMTISGLEDEFRLSARMPRGCCISNGRFRHGTGPAPDA
jgi:hypothetical protein